MIQELPWKVRFNLSLLLDRLEPPNHTWKSLIGELDNLQISSVEVNAVERQGQIPGKSPTEVLLNTLEHKNYTIDDIYRGLHKMEHRQAMDIIKKYVSPEVRKEIEELDAKQADNDVFKEEPVQLHDPNPLPPPPPSGLLETVSADVLTFSYQDLVEGTENFSSQYIIGNGGFGIVYKASIRNHGPFAIKKIHKKGESRLACLLATLPTAHLMKEIRTLCKYRHVNLLQLIACSMDGPTPCLIYDYMENGSLLDVLQRRFGSVLSWQTRMDISVGVSHAIHFLHTSDKERALLHGDIKSANILMDRYFVPKLGDFGLSSYLNLGDQDNLVLMGTYAYMAPECIQEQKMSTKSDVYSFGVVLMELLTGSLADDPYSNPRSLVSVYYQC